MMNPLYYQQEVILAAMDVYDFTNYWNYNETSFIYHPPATTITPPPAKTDADFIVSATTQGK